MAAVNPYLNFNGNCSTAFDFYKSVFGGEFAMKMLFKDMPAEHKIDPAESDLIMHISLPMGHGTVLMGSDRPKMYGPGVNGDNFYVSLQADSEEEAKRLFNALSAGGKVTMPLEKAFWGSLFGMWNDQFGIQWMISYAYGQGK